MKRIALITTLFLLVLVTGCKSKRAVVVSPEGDTPAVVVTPETEEKPLPDTPPVVVEEEDVIEEQTPEKKTPTEVKKSQENILYDNMVDGCTSWHTMVAKGSVSLGSLSSSFEMRMINNESMQISLRPIFGIEIARVVVTRDSLFLYDKINKRYIAEGLASFSDKIPFEPTISDLQNVLLGRPFILGHTSLDKNNFGDFAIETAGNNWAMQPLQQPDGIVYMFGFSGDELLCTLAQQAATQREVRCDYEDYETFSGRTLPTKLRVSAGNSRKSYSISISYSSVQWDTNTSVQKLSTSGSKKTTISTVIGSLLK